MVKTLEEISDIVENHSEVLAEKKVGYEDDYDSFYADNENIEKEGVLKLYFFPRLRSMLLFVLNLTLMNSKRRFSKSCCMIRKRRLKKHSLVMKVLT
jgi:hypothetical protein